MNSGVPIYLFGASQGACFVQRYIQEYKEDHGIEAAACVSSSWNTFEAANNFEANIFLR